MGAPAALLIGVHLVACLVVASVGVLVYGLGENRTPAQQDDAERLGLMMGGLLVLGIGIWICLLWKRTWLALAFFTVQTLIGAFVFFDWLEEWAYGDGWVSIIALVVAATGIGAIAAARPADA